MSISKHENNNYEQAVASLKLNLKFGIRLGLDRLEKLLFLLNNPEKDFKTVHVAGTNGKGSVCFMFSSIFTHNKYKTGLFISPYVKDLRESIQLNNQMITRERFAEIYQKVSFYEKALKNDGINLTYFEMLTAMALEFFSEENCDIVTLEVGLGGDLDATNVVKNTVLSVITSISFDHKSLLGNTLKEITLKKCGIIKKNCPVVVSPGQKKIVNKTILDYSRILGNKVKISNITKIKEISSDLYSGTVFLYKGKKFELPLLGQHQLDNVMTVFTGLEFLKKHFTFTYENVFAGLKKIYCPARFEILNRKPFTIIDGAHNKDGISALSKSLKKYLKNRTLIGITGMLSDKEVEVCFKNILPEFETIFTIEVKNERTMSLRAITNLAKKFHQKVFPAESLKRALTMAQDICSENSAIIIFGSFYIARVWFESECNKKF
ncbi:bifunctional folylpolyglutamate synthase/dihydrofolate synthase [Clostridia bacterium]|nr:bifunctional folylpolyglutamate synthase/dihydrofolate synthase [Clostridia bacterium]